MTNIKGRRMKTIYRDTRQKKAEQRAERIEYLKSLRSDTKKKTQRACLKV